MKKSPIAKGLDLDATEQRQGYAKMLWHKDNSSFISLATKDIKKSVEKLIGIELTIIEGVHVRLAVERTIMKYQELYPNEDAFNRLVAIYTEASQIFCKEMYDMYYDEIEEFRTQYGKEALTIVFKKWQEEAAEPIKK